MATWRDFGGRQKKTEPKEYPNGLSIDPHLGVWSLTFIAWGGLAVGPESLWLRILLILIVGATNSLLIRQIRFLEDRATRG